jgi:hypothetical protein
MLAVVLPLWIVIGWWWPISGTCGRLAAQLAVHRGRYRVLQYGIATQTSPDYEAFLKERYGLEIDGYGCVVTESETDYVAAYNAVTRAALMRRFGRDVLKEAGVAYRFDK